MTLGRLDDRVVIITGTSRGIGKEVALELAARGARVVISSRDAALLDKTHGEIADSGGLVASVAIDITDARAADLIVGKAIEAFGRVDALVNNAQQGGGSGPMAEQPEKNFDLALDSGPRAAFRLMKAVYPHMKAQGGGAIVNFGSGAGTSGLPGWATYAAAKEAMRGFSKVAAYEWGEDNIRVNTLCPLVATEGFASFAADHPDMVEALIAKTPLRRMGTPRADVAGVVAFLIGPDATYITGQTLFVDGGNDSIR